MNSARTSPHYPLDNGAPQAAARLASLSSLYDDVTFRHLNRFGIPEGGCCLEIGAGSGTVAAFMKERAGPGGQVFATDINTDALADAVRGGIEVCRHDIGADPLPATTFDIIHARAVLTFVPQRRSATERMMAALKPGGWILLEEMVVPPSGTPYPNDQDVEIADKARQAIVEVIRRDGGDLTFWHAYPHIFAEFGLCGIGAEGFFLPFRTAAVAALAKANVDQLRAAILGHGLTTAAELDRYRTLLCTPDLSYPPSMALISVWGQRKVA